MTSSNAAPALVIMGPTASGKTALALAAARRFNGEIISADSMQVYRRLDIGTAKPTAAERREIPHHLIDIRDIGESLEVFTFVRLALRAMAAIRSRGRLPIVAGGTGFYLRALLYGLDPLPADPVLRAELDRRYDHTAGEKLLLAYMREHDPEDLERWSHHRRKLIRACEVFQLTGKSITALQTLAQPQLQFPAAAFRLEWDRAVLRDRIARRTREMLCDGWIDEAREMIAAGVLESPTARQVLGYRYIADYLAGKYTYDAMAERIAVSTWQLARRQLTWFRHQHPEAEVIAMPQDTDVILDHIAVRLAEAGA
ncbi:MAG: tRNA (adenosine(37)-N6)-dimethylallyltransferase MiaA [Victivallales bacterium]|nr:tRNA (adenosine(37)-N6)-dimethylallyltransferase MiaA [Victivallales bacterium]